MTKTLDEPESLGQAATEIARRTSLNANSSGRPSNSTSSGSLSRATTPARCEKSDFAKAVAYLTAMKRTAELTPIQVQTWHGALGGFAPEIINAAVLEIALTDVRFPELGDLYQLCRTKAIRAGHMNDPYTPNGQAKKAEITAAEIREIGGRLGLKVI